MCMPTQNKSPLSTSSPHREAIMQLWYQQQQQQQQQQLMHPYAGQKRLRTSQVRFSNDNPLKYEDPHSPLSSEEVQKIWYQRSELASFKLSAKKYLLGIDRSSEEETRGYERFEHLGRARDKAIAIKCVLLAQYRGLKGEDMAKVSQRFSESAVEAAFVVGCQDYCQAYQPHMTDFIASTMGKFTKRTAEDEGSRLSCHKRRRTF